MRGLILLVAVGVVLFLLVRWFLNASPSEVVRKLRRWGGLGLLLAAGVLMLVGQIGLAIPLAAAGLGALMRGGMSLGGGAPSGGNRSQVRSRFVLMELDHDTGQVDGEVLVGRFAGRRLSDMGLEDLVALRLEAEGDPQSANLIEAYLDQMRPEWRESAGASDSGGQTGAGQRERARSAGQGPMTRQEALEILGLEEGADEKAIKAAYTRLMKRFHPDQGGSTYFAARLNAAREVLLKRKRT